MKGGSDMLSKIYRMPSTRMRGRLILTPAPISTLILLTALMLFSFVAYAATLEVEAGKPYATIQSAINAAKPGDTVLVDDGEYLEKINFLGKAITLKSVNGAAGAIIDDNGTGTVVTFNRGEGAGSTLDGFTIRKGHPGFGVGIYCESSFPTIINCIVAGNYPGSGTFKPGEGESMEMKAYHDKLRKVVIDGYKRLNRTRRVETRKWIVPSGSREISVVRGKVLEKATTNHVIINVKLPTTGEDTRLDIFQAHAYPANPKIPILLFNMENRVAKEERFFGYLDVAPVAAHKEDLDFLRAEIEKVTDKYGQDYETARKKIESIYKMDDWEKALNAGIGIRLEYAKEQSELVKEAVLTWVDSYFKIVKKREGEPYRKKEEALMNNVRTGIMEFYILKDRSFKISREVLGFPFESLALGSFAPTLRY